MKPLCLLIAILFCAFHFCAAQNLVPNPSFEDTLAGGFYPKTWQFVNETPDYFNNINGNNWIPNNPFGYQYPNTGNAYCGILSYESLLSNYREIIGIQLSDTLKVGIKYFVSFKTSLSNCCNCATNKLGLVFSVNPSSFSSSTVWQNNAKVYAVNKIADTLNWVTIQGSFIADSNYHFIYLGHFFSFQNIDTLKLNNGICAMNPISDCESYYYLDDVCVSSDSATCEIPTLIINGLNLISMDNFKISPNPSNTALTINFNENNFQSIAIVDVLGRQVFFDDKINSLTKKEIDVSQFPDGVYIVQLSSSKARFNKKISVVHSK